MYHMFDGRWHYGGLLGFGWLINLIIIGLIVWLIITLVSRGRDYYSRPVNNRALEILKERYARGEISKEEFEEKKRDLMR